MNIFNNFLYGTIWPICAESAVKLHQTSQQVTVTRSL